MELNTAAINALADRIEQCVDVEIDDHEPESGPAFTMFNDVYPCGLPGCILGHQREMAGRGKRSDHTDWAHFAADLGLTHAQTRDLCGPVFKDAHFAANPGQSTHITARRAGAVLRNLAATGNVDWTIRAN